MTALMLAHRLRRPIFIGVILAAFNTAQADDECQLNVSESRLDFGLMNRAAQRDSAAQRLLGERHLRLTFNCPRPTDPSLFYRALAANAERLQFTAQGSYALQVSEGVLDGQAVSLGLLPASGQPPIAIGTTLDWRPGHGIAPVQNGTRLTGKHFALQLSVSAWADAAATRVREATTWEASGSLHNRHASRELTLQAHFAPVACVPQLSNGGLVDYGTLLAKDMPLGEVIAELARYRPGVLRCDPAVAGMPVSGALSLTDTDAALDLLARSLPLRIERRTRYWVSFGPRG